MRLMCTGQKLYDRLKNYIIHKFEQKIAELAKIKSYMMKASHSITKWFGKPNDLH